jgi:hypothetical protein
LPLIDSLSAARLGTYLGWAGGDQQLALRLYDYNIRLSAALYGPLHMLEVSLRNGIDRQLQQAYGVNWPTNAGAGLTPYQSQSVTNAENTIRRQRKPVTHDSIVAELNFGFWTSFFGKDSYLQWQHLRPMFSVGQLKRAQIAQILDKTRDLRNRVAHYEPILSLPLDSRYTSIRELTSWINTDAAAWIDRTSSWPNVFLGNPTLDTDPLSLTLVVMPAVADRL